MAYKRNVKRQGMAPAPAWAEEQDVTSTWPLTGADVDPREVTSVSGRSNPQTPDPVRYPAPGDASCGYRAIRHRPVSIAGATIQRPGVVTAQNARPEHKSRVQETQSHITPAWMKTELTSLTDYCNSVVPVANSLTQAVVKLSINSTQVIARLQTI
ncbi:hypothetical protein J6590_047039 [Homalodisca vitripennis]|nr:hypothetical protein J6590_047039 [Homalodisca vitripennis]